MKKFFSLFAVAAFIGMFASCEKGDKTTDTPMSDPVNRENHLSADINDYPNVSVPNGGTGHMTYVGLPSSGELGVAVVQKEKESPDDPPSSQTISFKFEVETPSRVAIGTRYNIAGWGALTISELDGKNIKLLVESANSAFSPFFVSGRIRDDFPGTQVSRNLCRSWTIDETIVKVTGDGVDASLGAAKIFKGCSAHEIAEYMNSKGCKVEIPSKDSDVTQFSFDEAGGFVIFFAGVDPYKGNYTLNGNNLSYSFEFYNDDDPVIAGSASGTFKTVSKRGRLELNASLKDKNNDSYNVNVIFWLLPVA